MNVSHANQMKTYSGPEFSDDSFACFISSQEYNVLFLLECLQMRVRACGWGQLDYYNHPKWVPSFLLLTFLRSSPFFLTFSVICP